MIERIIKVLDHGYVKIIDYMGDDRTIIDAARMSTGRGFASWDPYIRCNACEATALRSCTFVCTTSDQMKCLHETRTDFPRGDLGLLETLWSSGHSTPFEMCELIFEVQAPLMVFREWHRHRTQSYSEFSARYSQMPDLHYVPEIERIQKQSQTMKQGSGEPFPKERAQQIRNTIGEQQGLVYGSYDHWVEEGLAKEVARVNTPVSRYSRMRAKANLRNWLGFLTLRMAPTAQWEIRQYANIIARYIEELYPKTWSLFLEHTLHSVRFSAKEYTILRELCSKLQMGFAHPLYEVTETRFSKKEREAFLKKIGIAP